jgi:hypothetical protein
MSWSVFVFPVPVAPAMRPWRFISASGALTSGSGSQLPWCIGAPSVIAAPPPPNAWRAASTTF